jgi:hypothetical protein
MRQYVWRGKLDDCLVSDCSVIERVYTQFSLPFDWDGCVSPDPNKSISLMLVVVVHHVLVLCMEAKWEHGLEGTVRFLMLSFRFSSSQERHTTMLRPGQDSGSRIKDSSSGGKDSGSRSKDSSSCGKDSHGRSKDSQRKEHGVRLPPEPRSRKKCIVFTNVSLNCRISS